jgi:murein DD-endopeptidase MepM/ murein hydrolase activator NlpD
VLQLQLHYQDKNVATALHLIVFPNPVVRVCARHWRIARSVAAFVICAAVPALLHTAPPLPALHCCEVSAFREVVPERENTRQSIASVAPAASRKRVVPAPTQRLSAPVSVIRVTSKFGLRVHPIRSRWHEHTGIDLAAAHGTPVLAAAAGTVRYVGRDAHYGNYIVVEHANHLQTWYGHLSAFGKGLRKGSVVQQGQRIGVVGRTGAATGPHLHFEVRKNGQPVDPVPMTDGFGRERRGSRVLKG